MPDLLANYQFTPISAIALVVTVLLFLSTLVLWQARHRLDARLDAVLKDRDRYRGLAEEAMTYLDALRTRLRVDAAEEDFLYSPRVQPVRHSDPTRIAEDIADTQSLRLRLDAIVEDLDRLSREAHERG